MNRLGRLPKVLIALFILLPVSGSLAETEALHKACKNNLANSAKSLEAYAEDHNGQLPTKIQELQPKYAPGLRVCPVTLLPYRFEKLTGQPRYRLICVGNAHLGVSPTKQGDMAYVDGQGVVWPYSGPALNQREKKNWSKRKRELTKKKWKAIMVPAISFTLAVVLAFAAIGLFIFKKRS